jgi:molecular chaperone GrpE
MEQQEKEILSNEEMTAEETILENLTEETGSDAQTPDSSPEGSSEQKLQADVDHWKDRYTRLFAEFDNYKKRTSKEISDIIKTAGKDVMVSLLDVMDDSERAAKQMETATDVQAVKEGLQLIINKLNHVMTAKGLKSFDSIGEEFDVEKHEAITEIPAPTPDMEGKVIDQVQRGYLLNDKLIRHAKVVVGKSPSA